MERLRETFFRKLGPVLGKLASSSLDKKIMISHSVFSPGLRYGIICIDEECQAIISFINLGLELDRDMK